MVLRARWTLVGGAETRGGEDEGGSRRALLLPGPETLILARTRGEDEVVDKGEEERSEEAEDDEERESREGQVDVLAA